MNYAVSVSDFFKTPKWGMSLLFGALAMFIPVAGWMLIVGWVITGFWSRREESFETFPPFDFTRFDKYLTRGVWPVLITLVPAFALMAVMMVLMFLMVGLTTAVDAQSGGGAAVMTTTILVAILVTAALYFVMLVVIVPLTLRAGLMQAFVPAFDVNFMKRFLTLTWKEVVLSTLFVTAATFLLQFAGMLAFCVGMYAVPVIMAFARMHLDKQLYAHYLARGGEPIPISPKLLDEPPPLPVS